MANPSSQPTLPAQFGQSWHLAFWENFTEAGCLEKNFWHPCGWSKWKWDAVTNKEIHWEPSCSHIVHDKASNKPVLRVSVFSDWFHRIDRLATKKQFGYGYFEARCRFKGAEGMHSAFWLLPYSMDDWADVPPGEIPGGIEVDVVEHRARDSGRKDISRVGNVTMHWGGYGKHHRSEGYKEVPLPGGDQHNWSTFGVMHMPGSLRWFWNGKEVNRVPIWSPRPNYIYFSTEVGESGGWAGRNLESYGPLENPVGYMEVDHCGFWESRRSTSRLYDIFDRLLQATFQLLRGCL